jgi:hypothetical protein
VCRLVFDMRNHRAIVQVEKLRIFEDLNVDTFSHIRLLLKLCDLFEPQDKHSFSTPCYIRYWMCDESKMKTSEPCRTHQKHHCHAIIVMS